jgi:hypothetical protein
MYQTKQRLRRFVAGVGCAAVIATGTGVLTAAPAHAVEPEIVCPADAGNARFVRWIYLNILFRCPDEAGAAYWTTQLNSGLPRDVFADIVDMSDENLINNNVANFYGEGGHGIVPRAATPQEITDGVASIRRYRSDGPLIAQLASSDEVFTALTAEAPANERDDAWLNVAYGSILDREPDAGGRAYFKTIMGTPSTASGRFVVAMVMEHSAENADSWVGAALSGATHRMPDPGGLAYWKGWLMGPGNWQTFRMWTLMLSSDEAYALAQTQPNPEVSAEAAQRPAVRAAA